MTDQADQNSVTVSVPVTVTKSDLSYLLCTAFESSVSYWCRILDYCDPAKPVGFMEDGKVTPYADFPLTPDGAVICYEELHPHLSSFTSDEGRDAFVKRTPALQLRLDFEAVQRGLRLFMTLDSVKRSRALFLSDNADANVADVFVQLCLFGEVKYG